MSCLGTEHQQGHQERGGRYQSWIPDASDEQGGKTYFGGAYGVSDEVRQSVFVELLHYIGQAYDPNERYGQRDDHLRADGDGVHGVVCFLSVETSLSSMFGRLPTVAPNGHWQTRKSVEPTLPFAELSA